MDINDLDSHLMHLGNPHSVRNELARLKCENNKLRTAMKGMSTVSTLPNNLGEAHALLLAAIMKNPPHFIRFEADEADWNERILHLHKIGLALDAYLMELGRDCAQHARNSFDARAFVDPIGDALDDMLGQMERAALAAREHHTLPAE